MADNLCWNCGHSFQYHNKLGGACTFEGGAGRCDCTGYEDAQYLGHQMKRDTQTLSDRRRLSARRAGK